MYTSSKSQITVLQMVSLMTTAVFGVGILTLSRGLADVVKTADGWISIFFGGLISMLISWFLIQLSNRYPTKTFYQYSPMIVGKWLGLILNITWIVYFIILAGYEARMMAELNHFWVLETIPREVMKWVYFIASIYVVSGGINTLGRLAQLLVFPMIVFFILVMLLSLKIFDINNLRPIMGMGFSPVFRGIPTTVFSYLGFEILLFMVAFMKHPKKAGRAMVIGIALPTIVYCITTVLIYGGLTVDETATLTWPTISLINELELPGIIFERFESVLMTIWTIEIFNTTLFAHYIAALGCNQLFKSNMRLSAYIVIPFIYLASLFPDTLNGLFKEGDYLGYAFLVLGVLMPIVLLIISVIKDKIKPRQRSLNPDNEVKGDKNDAQITE